MLNKLKQRSKPTNYHLLTVIILMTAPLFVSNHSVKINSSSGMESVNLSNKNLEKFPELGQIFSSIKKESLASILIFKTPGRC